MKINGQTFDANSNPDDIRFALVNADSSFPEYRAVHPDATRAVEPDVEVLTKVGHNFLNSGNYSESLSFFNQAEQAMLNSGNTNLIGLANIHAGKGHAHMGSAAQLMHYSRHSEAHSCFDKAFKSYDSASKLYLETSHYNDAEITATHAHRASNMGGKAYEFLSETYDTLDEEKSRRGKADYNQQKEMYALMVMGVDAVATRAWDDAIDYGTDLYSLKQAPIVKGALSVGEMEVGFSDSTPLGTSNIQQCLVMVVQDTQTDKTALAHINKRTNPQSIYDDVLQHMPSDRPLDVYLVGSRENAGKATSEDNINKCVSALKNRENLNIKKSDIWYDDTPTAVVFFPKERELKHGLPEISEPEQSIHLSAGCLFNRSGRLARAFSVEGESKKSAPAFMNDALLNLSRRYEGKSSLEVYSDVSTRSGFDEFDARITKALLETVKANSKETVEMVKEAAKLTQKNLPVAGEDLYRKWLFEPKYISEGATEKNAEFVKMRLEEKLGVSPDTRVDSSIKKHKVEWAENVKRKSAKTQWRE